MMAASERDVEMGRGARPATTGQINDALLGAMQSEPPHLAQLYQKKPWTKKLAQKAALPTTLRGNNSRNVLIGVAALSAVCTICQGFLYHEGVKRKHLGWQEYFGSQWVNGEQNIYFTFGAFLFLLALEMSPLVIVALLGGVISALCNGIACYMQTLREEKSTGLAIGMAVPTFIGTLPSAIYGFLMFIMRYINWSKDIPEVRKILREDLRNGVEDIELFDGLVEPERGVWTKILGFILGAVVIGLLTDISQFGYVAATATFVVDQLAGGLATGYILGVFDNLATLIIAMLSAGYDLGKSIVNYFADLFSYEKSPQWSNTDIQYGVAKLLSFGFIGWTAWNSWPTSVGLYDDNAPRDALGVVDAPTRFVVDYFTRVFNGVICMIVQDQIIDYVKVVNSKGEDRERYQMMAMNEALKSADIKDLVAMVNEDPALAAKATDDKVALWKAKVTTQQAKPSQSGRFACCKKRKDESLLGSSADIALDEVSRSGAGPTASTTNGAHSGSDSPKSVSRGMSYRRAGDEDSA